MCSDLQHVSCGTVNQQQWSLYRETKNIEVAEGMTSVTGLWRGVVYLYYVTTQSIAKQSNSASGLGEVNS